MRAKSGPLKGMNPTLTVVSLTVVTAFVVLGAVWTETAGALFQTLQERILFALKWYYIAIVAFVLAFVVWLGFGRYKNVRLGDDDERPEFTYFSWFSMLFAAGMGIGLIFWGIAAPVSHYRGNPFVEDGLTAEAAAVAMRLTFFHWGLSAWAVYALVALSLAYFAYRRKLPLTVRSFLQPILGERVHGALGHAVDVVAVFGTAFGVATSLGLGVQQMNTGLERLVEIEVSLQNQLWLLALVTVVATASAVSGVRRGVRVISDLNLLLSVAVLVFFLVLGPTRHLMNLLVETTGDYLQNLPRMSTWTDAQEHSRWQEQWTVFYWGWWIAWSPFVGMFIARISRGRTIREFVMGVLLVPTLFTFVWLAVTGGTALYLQVFGQGGIVEALAQDVTLPLYRTVQALDAGLLGSVVTTILVILIGTYFITSCDSGTLVITTILSDGSDEPPLPHRMLWGLGEGLLAAVLLAAGGLAALQAAAIVAGLPVALVLLVLAWGLVRGLREERVAPREGVKHRTDCEPWTGCAC